MAIEETGQIDETVDDGLQIGYGAQGEILVSDGSVLAPSDDIARFLSIGGDPGGDGVLGIVDAGSLVEGFDELSAGAGAGFGRVEVSDGGWLQLGALDRAGSATMYAGRGAGSDGRVDIDRGLVTLQGAELGDSFSARPYAAIGSEGGSGELSITGDAGANHGLVMAGGADSSFVTLDIGFNANGSATLDGGLLSLENMGRVNPLTTGADGDLDGDGGQVNLRVGTDNGDGSLTANAGAEIRLETGLANGAGFNVGANAGTGVAILDDSNLTVSSAGSGAFLTTGTTNGDGTLTLRNGTQAQLDAGMGGWVVFDTGGGEFGQGTATLTGTGTRVAGNGESIGRVAVGNEGGTGSLRIEDGAEVEIETVGFNGLWVGNLGGTGSFELTDSARHVVRSTGEGEFENSYMMIGVQGGTGSALIDDAELVLDSASPFAGLRVAAPFLSFDDITGTGDLTIQNGAQVAMQATQSNDLWIGGGSEMGTARILSGSEVDLGGNGLLFVGRPRDEQLSDGSGQLTISGEDTRVIGVETAEIGRFGATGTLEVTEAAQLSVSGGLVGGDAELGGTPRIFIDAGTIEAEDMLLHGGVLAGSGLLRDIGAAEGFADLQNTTLKVGDVTDSAGELTTGIGELRIEGDMAQSGGRADFDFDAQAGDQLIVTGSLTFEGTSIALNWQGVDTSETEILLARADDGITLEDETFETTGLGGAADLELREDQTELWAVFEGTDPVADGTVGGTVSGRDGAPLDGVTVSLTDDAETLASVQTDAAGAFVFDLEDGAEGRIELSRDHTEDDPSITASDALEVLRLAVGLEPSWGPAEAEDFIAADMNRDGQVTAQDALEVLRHAVGLETEHAPEWVFLDAQADLGDIDRDTVAYDTGVEVAAIDASQELSMTGILTGSMQEHA